MEHQAGRVNHPPWPVMLMSPRHPGRHAGGQAGRQPPRATLVECRRAPSVPAVQCETLRGTWRVWLAPALALTPYLPSDTALAAPVAASLTESGDNKCYNCGDFANHLAAKCPHGPLPKRCHQCKSTGHLIADCPLRDHHGPHNGAHTHNGGGAQHGGGHFNGSDNNVGAAGHL
ncbi:hypothetical protein ACOMHN_060081 [Nucella lapillus]